MSFTMFSLAMLLICVLCIGKEAFKGFRSGLFPSLILLSSVISSIICAIVFARPISRLITLAVMAFIRNEILGNVSVVGGSTSLDRVVSFFVQSVINSMIFAVLFLIFKGLINLLLKLILKRKTKNEGEIVDSDSKKDKLAGAIVGVACGILVAAAVTAPVMGTLNIARDTVGVIDVIDEDMLAGTDFDRSALDAIDKYASDIPGNFCYSMGGKLIYSQIAVGEFNGKTVSAVSEIAHLKKGLQNVLEIVGRFSGESINFDEKIEVDKLYESLDDSEIIKTLISESISEFSSSWLRGESFMGISRPNFNDNIDPLVDSLLAVCAGTNAYNVKSTIGTLFDIFSVLVECGISADSRTEDINYSLLVKKLYDVLDKNPDMEPVKRGLVDLAMGVIAENLIGRISETDFRIALDRIAKETNEIFNLGGYDIGNKKEILSENISKVLDQYGVSVDGVVTDLASEKLIEMANDFGGRIDISDLEELMKYFTGSGDEAK